MKHETSLGERIIGYLRPKFNTVDPNHRLIWTPNDTCMITYIRCPKNYPPHFPGKFHRNRPCRFRYLAISPSSFRNTFRIVHSFLHVNLTFVFQQHCDICRCFLFISFLQREIFIRLQFPFYSHGDIVR